MRRRIHQVASLRVKAQLELLGEFSAGGPALITVSAQCLQQNSTQRGRTVTG